MPYKWHNKTDVDEAVLVVKNTVDIRGDLPDWLARTIIAARRDSDPVLADYFCNELKKSGPEGAIYIKNLLNEC